MDSAGPNPGHPVSELRELQARIEHLEQCQRIALEQTHVTTQQVYKLTEHLCRPSETDPGTPRENRVPDPEPFSGELNACRGFLVQCAMVLEQRSFTTDIAKRAYIFNLLRGKALAWAEARLTRSGSLSSDQFQAELRTVFDHPDHAGNAAKRLLALRQGSQSAAEYAVDFHILAADVAWGEDALGSVFSEGLNEGLKDALAYHDVPTRFDALVELAIRLDNRLSERRRDRGHASRLPPQHRSRTAPSARTHELGAGRQSLPADDQPMQLGHAPLSAQERARHLAAGLCLYCGQLGTRIAQCAVRPKDRGHQ